MLLCGCVVVVVVLCGRGVVSWWLCCNVVVFVCVGYGRCVSVLLLLLWCVVVDVWLCGRGCAVMLLWYCVDVLVCCHDVWLWGCRVARLRSYRCGVVWLLVYGCEVEVM